MKEAIQVNILKRVAVCGTLERKDMYIRPYSLIIVLLSTVVG